MTRRKLLIVLISLAAILVTLISQETIAYYSVLGETVNVVTAGEISIQVAVRQGNKEAPADGVYVRPGSTIARSVLVQNNGENPCWVRVKLTNGIEGGDLSADVLQLNINTTDWIVGEDGYYYYNRVLQPNTETEVLFSQMKIAGTADNRYAGKSIRLRVNAYAVQSEYNEGNGSPLDVAGWPAES